MTVLPILGHTYVKASWRSTEGVGQGLGAMAVVLRSFASDRYVARMISTDTPGLKHVQDIGRRTSSMMLCSLRHLVLLES